MCYHFNTSSRHQNWGKLNAILRRKEKNLRVWVEGFWALWIFLLYEISPFSDFLFFAMYLVRCSPSFLQIFPIFNFPLFLRPNLRVLITFFYMGYPIKDANWMLVTYLEQIKNTERERKQEQKQIKIKQWSQIKFSKWTKPKRLNGILYSHRVP